MAARLDKQSAQPSAPRAPQNPQGLSKPAGVEPKSTPSLDRDIIARAAYFRWLERGGDERTNWLEAEAELKGKTALKL